MSIFRIGVLLALLPWSVRAELEYFPISVCDEKAENLCADFMSFEAGTEVTVMEEGGDRFAHAVVKKSIYKDTAIASFSASPLQFLGTRPPKFQFSEGVRGRIKEFKRIPLIAAAAVPVKTRVGFLKKAIESFKESYLQHWPEELNKCLKKGPPLSIWRLAGVPGYFAAQSDCGDVSLPMIWHQGRVILPISPSETGKIEGVMRIDGKIFLKIMAGTPASDNVGPILHPLD